MFSFCKASLLMVLSLAVAGLPMQVLAQQGFGREFAPGQRRLPELPEGKFRNKLEKLPAQARDRALAWLGNIHFTTEDLSHLQVDPDGGVFYADEFPLPAGALGEEAPVASEAAVQVSPFPGSLIFHSKPGAPNVIYLNFCGETVMGTAWNSSEGRNSFSAVSFSSDSDHSTFSDAEQAAIKKVWQRIAEDYSPFDVDVTTERPATFSSRTAHVLITRNTDANGVSNPASTAGGVAYVNVFGSSSFSTYRPAWVYYNNLGSDESYVAEAASHEAGHNMGLSHDGKTDGADYYGGHGSGETSWAPIMGVGYNRNVSQWSKGEYYLANNTQDDLATLAGKLSYRADDHGNTSGSATALQIISGTTVLSTTPQTDPHNTNKVNKGIIERNTDVDVFSFATGNGQISLAASPWVNPTGTKGGNIDILLRLYNSAGQLIITNNAGDRTSARIETILSEGIYYLHVAGTGVGSPATANPNGYTSYGSAGQYFVTGAVVASSSVIPPGAELTATHINQTGMGTKEFSVTYSDNMGIDVSTIDSADLLVAGPNGFSKLARLVSVDLTGNGTPRQATYAVEPPNSSSWTKLDNGVYSVTMVAGQVADVEGASVAPQELGTFNVSVPDSIYFASMDSNPGWTLASLWKYGAPSYGSSGPSEGYTGTQIIGFNLSGNYPNNLQMAYATTPAINCTGASSLVLKFRRWLRLRNSDTAVIQVSTNGTSWTSIWSSTRSVSDSSWQEVQYSLPAWTAGSSSLRVRWGLASGGSQNDLGWNIDDVEIHGERGLDIAPPAGVLSVANLVSGGMASHSFTVTYADDTAVSVATLDSSDVLVTGPNGYSQFAAFSGVNNLTDGKPRVATYSVAAPGGFWDALENGVYTIAMQAGQVSDTAGNSVPSGVLGSFTVAVPESRQAIVISAPALDVVEGNRTAFQLRLAEQPFAPITVNVSRISGDTNLVLESPSSYVFSSTNWSTEVSVRIRARTDTDQENGSATFECGSAGLNSVTLIATEVDTTLVVSDTATLAVELGNNPAGTVNITNGTYQVGEEVTLIAQPAPYFKFNGWTGDFSSTNNPLTFQIGSNTTLRPLFVEEVTPIHSVPFTWLAENGVTNNLESSESLLGANGVPLWQSYIAGLDPNDASSQLKLTIRNSGGETVLSWNSVEGRIYSIKASSNPEGPFVPLANLPAEASSLSVEATGGLVFYRLEVALDDGN